MNISKSTVSILSLYLIIMFCVNSSLDNKKVDGFPDVENSNETNPSNSSYVIKELETPPIQSQFETKINENNENKNNSEVDEPVVKDKNNVFCLAEALILYSIKYFGRDNVYLGDIGQDVIFKILEKLKQIKDEVKSDPKNLFKGDKKETQPENEEKQKEKDTFPSGNHLLTVKCIENGFLKCKDTDHTEEIFNLIIKNDGKIINRLSIDEDILEAVINSRKMLTIDENNKLVEFINVLLKNKSNDQIDQLEKSNCNGYNLIHPKCNSTCNLCLFLFRILKDKATLNYEKSKTVSS